MSSTLLILDKSEPGARKRISGQRGYPQLHSLSEPQAGVASYIVKTRTRNDDKHSKKMNGCGGLAAASMDGS